MQAFQLTYGMMAGDAVSNHVLEIDARLRAWGYDTTIYAQHIAPEMAGRVRPDWEIIPQLSRHDVLLIYHYSIYSPNTRFFQASRGRRMLVYHNITPGAFFRAWDAGVAAQCDVGRAVLGSLCDCDLAVGVSDYNRQELIQAGCPAERTGVLPIFLSQKQFESLAPDAEMQARLRGTGQVNWLTVGRVVPNKAVDEIIRLFYVYRCCVNAQAHLYVVGSRYMPAYDRYLDALIAELELSEHVTLAGRVSDAQLVAFYQAADLYIIASHHEGFCVPAIESMYFGVPVLARKAAATPETLGEAGLLYSRLGYEEVAEAAHILATDREFRDQVIGTQRRRLRALAPEQAELMLRKNLTRLGLPVGG